MTREHNITKAAASLPDHRGWGLFVLAALLTMGSTTARADEQYGRDLNNRSVKLVHAQPGGVLTAGEPIKTKRLTAEDVIQLWAPRLQPAQDYGQMGATPGQSPSVAGYTFRVIGPTVEELWNHYAQLCGMKQQYEEKSFQIRGDTGPNGSYVVADRLPPPGKLGRGLSLFLLKTDGYTVTVTFQADPDGKSITGSLTAVASP
jgi:hypothetical protein